MARIRLDVDDPVLRLTLKAMLEAEGHAVSSIDAELCIAEGSSRALESAGQRPTLLLTTGGGLGEAVQAMRRGVYGYIVVPLVPGEAALMVQRALSVANGSASAQDNAPKRLEEVERAHIESVLRQCKHNQAEAARVLGIGRNTLWRKLKQYGASEAAV